MFEKVEQKKWRQCLRKLSKKMETMFEKSGAKKWRQCLRKVEQDWLAILSIRLVGDIVYKVGWRYCL
ncbi:MAG: hypothetical protein WCI63_04080 [bacterium]